LLVTGAGSKGKAPAQDFIVGATFQNAAPQGRKLDPDKAAATAIETQAQVIRG
jgi:hypothetical protein